MVHSTQAVLLYPLSTFRSAVIYQGEVPPIERLPPLYADPHPAFFKVQLVIGQFVLSELVANSLPALTDTVVEPLSWAKANAAVVGLATVKVAQLRGVCVTV